MPKPKTFLKEGKKKKGKDEPALETADDYQAAGVEFEEAAGKHRAGDAVKSMKFFERAIHIYDEGLVKFPKSFDLAYNKARVQYEVATHPKLAKQLQQPVVNILRVALASHEYALKLDESDPDLLFNTAQVLTSIAEESANDDQFEEAVRLLQSALELQARCFSAQEQRYDETLQQQEVARKLFENASGEDAITEGTAQHEQPSDGSSTQDGKWASVVEPVTAETLIDTIIAYLGTLTTLSTTITSSGSPSWINILAALEGQGSQLLGKAQSLSLSDLEKLHDIALANAILRSALLDAAFTFDSLSADTYRLDIEGVWSTPSLELETSADALVARANALIAFNFSISTKAGTDSDTWANMRWTALASAIKSLTTASKISSTSSDDKTKTHLLRGDASLLQYRMSNVHKQAAVNSETLLKNAQVFYRNAAQLSIEQEEKEHALFRCGVVQQIEQTSVVAGGEALKSIFGADRETRAAQELQDMLDEGLLVERTDEMELTVYA